MKTIVLPLLATLAGLLRSRSVLHLEILALRQQLAMVTRTDRKLRFRQRERLFWIWLYRIWPGCLETLIVFKADTLVRWHRQGFRLYWTWKCRRGRGGRPPVSREVRALIRPSWLHLTSASVNNGLPRLLAARRRLPPEGSREVDRCRQSGSH